MYENKGLKRMFWLVPIIIIAILVVPLVIKSLSGTPNENKSKPSDPIVSEQPKETPTDKPIESESPTEETIEPQLKVSETGIIDIIEGDVIDFSKYIKVATDSQGNDMTDKLVWSEFYPNMTDVLQSIMVSFTDEKTGIEMRDVLLIKVHPKMNGGQSAR